MGRPQAQLLTDLSLTLVDSRALSIYRVHSHTHRDVVGCRSVRVRDYGLRSGNDNLAQAITLRLLTPKGELTPLGHPEYGSRLPELIGQGRTETTRNLAKLYVIEALKQEPRIARILSVDVTDHAGDRHRINLSLRVDPIDGSGPIDLGPLTLDLAP